MKKDKQPLTLVWRYLRALFLRLTGAGRNPEKRPLSVRMDPGLRRDDGGFGLS
jgi:hypothetical protein